MCELRSVSYSAAAPKDTSAEGMELIWTKVIVMALTSVVPLLFSLLPLWFKSYLVPANKQGNGIGARICV